MDARRLRPDKSGPRVCPIVEFPAILKMWGQVRRGSTRPPADLKRSALGNCGLRIRQEFHTIASRVMREFSAQDMEVIGEQPGPQMRYRPAPIDPGRLRFPGGADSKDPGVPVPSMARDLRKSQSGGFL